MNNSTRFKHHIIIPYPLAYTLRSPHAVYEYGVLFYNKVALAASLCACVYCCYKSMLLTIVDKFLIRFQWLVIYTRFILSLLLFESRQTDSNDWMCFWMRYIYIDVHLYIQQTHTNINLCNNEKVSGCVTHSQFSAMKLTKVISFFSFAATD